MAFFSWSKTAASNASADATINWAEGQPPASYNDSARAMMARLAEYRDDTSGLLATGGTATAYTLTTNQGLVNPPADGQLIAFTPHAGNGVAATLFVDGGGAYPLQSAAGTALAAASLVQGTPYAAKFNASANAWIMFGLYSNPFGIPVGAVLPYFGATAPNANFALPFGQLLSTTTYSVLFALIGTTFGSGGGTFALPDLRGRGLFGLDNMGGSAANRITAALNFDGTILGNTGGAQSHTLSTTEIPSHNHTATDFGHTHSFTYQKSSDVILGGANLRVSTIDQLGDNTGAAVQGGAANIGVGNTGGGGAHTILNPAMVVPFILRII
jgi:microcystin-dependent protein